MKQHDFLSRVLGVWSSHPHWLKLRLRTMLGMLLAAAAIITAGLIWVAGDSGGRHLLLQNAGLILRLAVLLAALLAGFMSAVALLARIAAIQVHSRRTGREFAGAIDPWVLALILVIGLLLPLWLGHHPGIPPLVQRLVQMLAFVPVVALLWLIRAEESEGAGRAPQPVSWRVIFSGAAALAATAAFAIWTLRDIARLQQLESLRQRLEPWLPQRFRDAPLLLGPWVLAVLAVVLILLWRSFRSSQQAAAELAAAEAAAGSDAALQQLAAGSEDLPDSAPAASAPVAPHLPTGSWQKLCHWWKSLWSGTAAQPSSAEPPAGPPAWAAEILLAAGLPVQQPERLLIHRTEAAPPARPDRDGQLWCSVFPTGLSPTVDQVAAVRAFDQLYQQTVQAAAASGTRLDPGLSADLLLAGSRGAGRTSALIACAVYAAFVRGQFVLLLVSDPQRESLAVEQVRQFLQGLRLHYYLHCSSLQDAVMEEWLQSAQPLPHIVVAHPESLERSWFSHQTGHRSEHVRLVHLPEVLLVDDLGSFSEQQSFHLPFLVDKQRLLLESEGRILQTVVGVDQLSAAGRELVLERITGRKGLDADRHLLLLRPRRPASVWWLSLSVLDASAAADILAQACLRQGRSAALFVPGTDHQQQQRRREQLERAAASPAGRMAVLGNIEQAASGTLPEQLHAAIFLNAVTPATALALRMQHGGPETVVFRLQQRGLAELNPGQPQLPVLTSRHAQCAAAAHFAGLLAFIRPQQPVPLAVLQRFGLRLTALPRLQKSVSGVLAVLELDCLPRGTGTGTAAANAELATGLLQLPVPLLRNLFEEIWEHRGLGVRLRLDVQRRWLLVCLEPPEDQQRLARWQENGAALPSGAATDLAHARRLLLLLRHRTLTAATVRSIDAGTAAVIDSDAWIGDGSDRCIPVERIHWTAPVAGWHGFLGGPADGYRWILLPAVQPDAKPLQVQVELAGLASEQGEVSSQAVHHSTWTAAAAVLVLRPADLSPEQLAERTTRGLAGSWSTQPQQQADDRAGEPELAAAVEAALRAMAPGIESFLRIMAFRLSSERRLDTGEVAVWLLQPATGGETAARLLRTILRHTAPRKDFFRLVRQALETLQQSPGSAPLPLLLVTGWNIHSSLDVNRIPQVLDLLPPAD